LSLYYENVKEVRFAVHKQKQGNGIPIGSNHCEKYLKKMILSIYDNRWEINKAVFPKAT
jgi:hypothetical protein